MISCRGTMSKGIVISIGILLLNISNLFAGDKYALIIGINDYKHPRIQDLNYSEADASYLSDVLFRYGLFLPANIKILLGADATYANIKREIYWLGEVAKKDDIVFFYFSGHGTRVEDTDGNEEDGMDEAFCPWETDLTNKASIILDDELGHWFERIKAEQIIVVLDCCHSGGAAGRTLEKEGTKGIDMNLPTEARGLRDPDLNPYAKDLVVTNKFIMSASDAEQQSFENPELGHGVFTYYLGEAISGNADADADEQVTAKEIFDYTKVKTEEFAKIIKKKQTPVQFGSLDMVVTEVKKQLGLLSYYDPKSKSVDLNIGEGFVKAGDMFVIKRSGKNATRDLNVTDSKVMTVKIQDVYSNYSEGIVLEEYFDNIVIRPEEAGDYYAEKLAYGSVSIFTEPWSTVYMNGKEIGATPLSISEVPEGEYELEFKIKIMGYPSSLKKSITVETNKKTHISEIFQKIE